MSDFLDEAQDTETFQVAGDTGHGEVGQEGFEIGTAHATDVELRALQGAEQGVLSLVEEVEALDAMTVDRFGSGEFVEAATAGGEVIERGEEFEIAAVTPRRISRRSIRL